MKKLFIKIFMAFNVVLIRLSGGRMGSQFGTQTVLILHTIGRKTGSPRSVPIAYFRDGANFFIVGSNWGSTKHASWYFNLKGNPQATLEVNGKKILTLAHEAEGEEYDRLWKLATKSHPAYEDYKKTTEQRHMPILVFQPLEAGK